MRKSPRALAALPRWLPRAVASVALLLAALQQAAHAQAAHAQAVHAQADPAAVFRQAVDARNRGDLEGVMAAFADDAVRQDTSCLPPCVGAAAIRQSMQANIAAGHQATVLAVEARGDTLTVRAEVRSDTFRAGGAERIVTIFRVELRGGKIVLWSSSLDASDAETAAFTARRAALQAQAAQAPPAPAPAPAAPAPVARLPRTGAPGEVPALAMIAAAALVACLGVAGRGLRLRR